MEHRWMVAFLVASCATHQVVTVNQLAPQHAGYLRGATDEIDKKNTPALPDWAANLPVEQLGKILRPREAAEFFGIARTTLWRYVKTGQVPEPLHLSFRARGWTVASLLAAQAGMRQSASAQKGV